MNFIWYTVLIRAIPESIGITLVVLGVINDKRSIKSIFPVSIFCGLVAFVMRMLPIKFGIHTFISIVLQAFIISINLKVKLQKVFKGMLVSLIVLIFAEMATVLFTQYVLNMRLEEVAASPEGTLLMSIPSVAIMYIAAFAIYRYNMKKYQYKEALNHVNQ